MLLHLVAPLLLLATTTSASLSDPLNLGSGFDREFKEQLLQLGDNYDYVKGSIFPQPQKQIDQNLFFTLDPENFE